MRPFKWKYRYNILSVLFFVWAVAVIDRMAMPVALPYIVKEFGLGPFEASLVLSTFFIGYAIAQVPGGLFADLIGVRKVATIAMLWWSAFTALTGAAGTLVHLLIVRLLFGLGEGLYPAASLKAVATWFPKKERSTATAVMFTANSIAAASAPLLVVAIMATWGWRSVFYVFCVPGILAAALAWRFLKNRPSDVPTLDPVERAELADNLDPELSEGAGGKLRALLDPTLLKYFFCYLTFDIALYAFQGWLPTYLVQARGFSMVEMAAATSLPFVVGGIGGLAGGWLSDNLFRNHRRSLVALTQILSGGALCLTFLAPTTTYLVVFQSLTGFFMYMFVSAFWGLPMNTLAKSRMGVASGFIQTGGQIGGFVSPVCIGAVLALSGGDFGAAGLVIEGAVALSFIIVWLMPAPARVP